MVQLQSDGTPFKPGQLFDPTTFSYQQASMLNMNGIPGQSLSAANSPAQILAAQQLSPNIPASSLTPATPLITGNPPQGVDTAGAMVAGATQGVRTFDENLALVTPPESDDSRRRDTLTGEVDTLLAQNTGRGAAQMAAESALGLPEKNKQLADINAQILQRTAAYNKLSTNLEGQPISMNSIIGGQAQIRKAEASEIGLLNAISLGLQGQVAAAQATADRAVDLKYDDIEAQLDMRLKQLDLIQDRLDDDERRRSDALKLYLEDQREASDERKALEKQFDNLMISGLNEGMTAATAQRAKALFEQGRSEEAYAMMSQWTGTASGDGRGGTGDGVGTAGFKNSTIETSVREDVDVEMEEILAGNKTVEASYARLRRLYSQSDVSDQALKDLLGIVDAEESDTSTSTFSSNIPSGSVRENLRPSGRNVDTPASRTVSRVTTGITNWFKNL